jgi:hypothetical protein
MTVKRVDNVGIVVESLDVAIAFSPKGPRKAKSSGYTVFVRGLMA